MFEGKPWYLEGSLGVWREAWESGGKTEKI